MSDSTNLLNAPLGLPAGHPHEQLLAARPGQRAAHRSTELPRIPVLLLAGGHDLSTPLEGARAQAALAPDGRLFVVPAAGHSVQNRAAGDPAEAELARFLG
jgi:pimeloyl-ACP methyl ester carboxylesterase